MKRCSACVLPDVYPTIIFDEDGVCNFCNNSEQIVYLGAEKLKQDLIDYINKNGSYDCLVPVSGGKDSTFVLYFLSKQLNMKVLAYNYDNCLTHPQAQNNVQRITNSLGVDLVTIRNEKQVKFMITNLKAYLRKPSLGMIPMLCTGCRYGIIGNAFNIAKRHHIPVIIIGWSPMEDTPFKEAYLQDGGSSVMRGLLKNLFINPAYLRLGNMIAAIKDYYHNYQHVKDWNIVLRLLHPGVKLIQFFDYIPYNPDDIQQILENEVGWKTPDSKNSWQWDCKIKLLQNYFYIKEINFTATDNYLSALIRQGLLSRREALERLQYSHGTVEEKQNQLYKFLSETKLEELKPHFS
jgi:hypothetical protein